MEVWFASMGQWLLILHWVQSEDTKAQSAHVGTTYIKGGVVSENICVGKLLIQGQLKSSKKGLSQWTTELVYSVFKNLV